MQLKEISHDAVRDHKSSLEFHDITKNTIRISIEDMPDGVFYVIRSFDNSGNLVCYIRIPDYLFFGEKNNIIDMTRHYLIPISEKKIGDLFLEDALEVVHKDLLGNYYFEFPYKEMHFIRICLVKKSESNKNHVIRISEVFIDEEMELNTIHWMEMSLESFKRGKLQSAISYLHYKNKVQKESLMR